MTRDWTPLGTPTALRATPLVGALMAARALVWLPGPILFFTRLPRIRQLPSGNAWTHVSLSLRSGNAAISALLALLAIGVGIALVAGVKRARPAAPIVLWAMLVSEALVIVGLVIPDLLLLPRLMGYWLPTLASLGLTAREAIADIGWAAVLIVFLRRLRADPDADTLFYPLRGQAVPSMVAVVALLVAFREGLGIVSAPFALNSLIGSFAGGSWLSPVALASAASVAAPVLAIVCAITLPLMPRITRTLTACALAGAILRAVAQLAIVTPSSAMSGLTVASVYFVPAATVLEYAAMAWALTLVRAPVGEEASDES